MAFTLFTRDSARVISGFGWVAVLVTMIAVGWIFYSRRASALEGQREAEKTSAEESRRELDRVGGGDLKILTFYPNPAVVKRGDTATLCYGVAFAKAVRIEPEPGDVSAALSRCIEIKPQSETSYKITATGADGKQVSETAIVKVQ